MFSVINPLLQLSPPLVNARHSNPTIAIASQTLMSSFASLDQRLATLSCMLALLQVPLQLFTEKRVNIVTATMINGVSFVALDSGGMYV